MNSTSNSTYFDTHPGIPELIEIGYQVAFFIIGTPVNILALWHNIKHYRQYRKQKRMGRTRSENRLVRLSLHLIVANLMVLCIYCPWRTYWFINVIWIDGDLLCRIFSFVCTFPFHLWSNLVAAIAIDMLCCVRSPLRSYHSGDHCIRYLLIGAWLWAIACSAPMTIFKGTIQIPGTIHYQCYSVLNYFHGLLFNTFHLITVFYLPLVIIIVCYTWTGVALKKRMAKRRQMVNQPDPVTSSPNPSFHSAGSRRPDNSVSTYGESIEMNSVSEVSQKSNTSALQQMKRSRSTKRQEDRFLRVSVTIITVFVLSWLPYQVMAVLRLVCEPFSECSEFLLKMNWTQAALIASACVNPFLYRYKAKPSVLKRAMNTTTATLAVINTEAQAKCSLTVPQERKKKRSMIVVSCSTQSQLKAQTHEERRRSHSLSTANCE